MAIPNGKNPGDGLDKMIAKSLRDVVVDDEDIDENDPELMNELLEIIGDPKAVSKNMASQVNSTEINSRSGNSHTSKIIKERIELYKKAESNADTGNEPTRARRFRRGLSTLEDLLKQVNSGKEININEIPPEVTVKNPSTSKEVTDKGTQNE